MEEFHVNNFKKITVILLVFATLFTLTAFSSACTIAPETSDYAKTVANFCKMKPDEIYSKIENNDKFVLFLGRETCHPCTQFVPILNEAAQEVNAEIFYMDCLDAMPGDSVYEFFKKYNISFIPTLLFFDGENYTHPRTPDDLATLKKLLSNILR